MMSSPSAEPAGVAPRRPARQQRGFIASYGVGRVCADLGCCTTLSRYNKSALCWQHSEQLEDQRRRDRS
jgi:hypothetical protein